MAEEDNRRDASASRVRAPDYRDVYSNSTIVRLSPYDVAVIFGRSVEGADGQGVSEDQVTVVMSPQHTKAFISVLKETFDAYERLFGTVNLPDQIVGAQRSSDEIVSGLRQLLVEAAAAKPSEAAATSTTPPPRARRTRRSAQE